MIYFPLKMRFFFSFQHDAIRKVPLDFLYVIMAFVFIYMCLHGKASMETQQFDVSVVL